ncbi:PREDICTED: cilia- and flagella-associated protein 20-like [Vollenhovia emeryi]|uniref:cilia- and flagella-associated protein 20-like n=1 Tax=Vollenhovia emeryi TaxID=411798 RepID=UPI0005F4D5E4|nr:PREDICTED: cilia- and flagella-associated protein 20-like [Vollenhovia emeryi]
MFRNTYQGGFLSILYSCGSTPLELWDMHVKNGYIRRITDEEIKSLALEIAGTNVATTYIYCPADPKKVLGIKLPFLIIIIKNMKKYFTFEITILDDKNMHRRFRVSNFQSTTRVRPFCTSMPIGLSGGWNQIQFNLCDFTRRAYGTNYIETTRMQIHANCRIRRIYFADRLYSEDEMPEDFKLFFPVHRKKCVREGDVLKKPSLVPEKVPSIVKEEPIIEPEVLVEETIEPPTITKEPDLVEETMPDVPLEKVEKIIVEEVEEKEEEEEEEELEDEEEQEDEEEKEKEELEEEEEEEEAEVEETVVFDEEKEVEPADVTRKEEDEEEVTDTSKLEEDYTEDEANEIK